MQDLINMHGENAHMTNMSNLRRDHGEEEWIDGGRPVQAVRFFHCALLEMSLPVGGQGLPENSDRPWAPQMPQLGMDCGLGTHKALLQRHLAQMAQKVRSCIAVITEQACREI